jgi:hypothetical protein
VLTPRVDIQIRGRQDFTSALGADNDHSATNSPDIITIFVGFFVTNFFFATQIYFLTEHHTSDMTDKEGRMEERKKGRKEGRKEGRHTCPSPRV